MPLSEQNKFLQTGRVWIFKEKEKTANGVQVQNQHVEFGWVWFQESKTIDASKSAHDPCSLLTAHQMGKKSKMMWQFAAYVLLWLT